MAPLEVTLEDLQRWLRNVDCPLNDCRALDIPQSLEHHQRRLEHLKHLVEEPAEYSDESSCCSATVSGDSESTSVPQSVLRHELEVVRGIVDGLRSLHSPIRRLPPELLSEIFHSCLPQDDNLDTPKPYEAPLLLGQVCGYWREVSLSTPSLWSSFDLVIRDPDLFPEPSIPTINQRRVALFYLWLSRSAAHPFTLSLNDYSHDGDVSGEILTQHFGRFRSLRLVVPTADSRPSLPTSGTFPFLRSFEIRTPYGLHPGTMADVSNLLLNHTPNLRTFIWINFTNHQHSGIKLRWSNLTRLTLNASVSVAQCLAIMSEAQELTHLTFQDICIPSYPSSLSSPGGIFSGYGPGQPGHITLYHLAVLVIRVYEPFSPFFDAITLPALKEMVLNTRQCWDHASFMGFLDRSKCPLETFNLYFPPIKPAELVQCLERVQGTLKEFTVQGDSWLEPCITDDIMDQLTNFVDVPDHQVDSDGSGEGELNSLPIQRSRLQRPILCPNVEVIALYDCMSCTHGRFTEMARSRLVHRPPPGLANSRLSSSSKDDLGFCADTPQIQHPEGTSQVARLKVLELYNNEPEIELLKELRHLGLVLKIYSESDGSPIELDQEDADTLKKLREEGLVLRVYQASTGHFGIAD